MKESTNRVAWTQTREQGRGSGFDSLNDRQSHADKNGKPVPFAKDYYKQSKGKE